MDEVNASFAQERHFKKYMWLHKADKYRHHIILIYIII